MKNGDVLENSKDILDVLERAGSTGKIFDVVDVTENLGREGIVGPIVDKLFVGHTYRLASLTLVFDQYWPQDKDHIACFRNLNESNFRLGKLTFGKSVDVKEIIYWHALSIFQDSVVFYEFNNNNDLHPVLIVVHDLFESLLVSHFTQTNIDEIVKLRSSAMLDLVELISSNAELDILLYPEEFI